MGLEIEHYQLKLKYRERSLVLLDKTDLKYQVRIGGSRHQFVSPPTLHGGVELVVSSIRSASVHGVLRQAKEGFLACIGNEKPLCASDLCGDRGWEYLLKLLRPHRDGEYYCDRQRFQNFRHSMPPCTPHRYVTYCMSGCPTLVAFFATGLGILTFLLPATVHLNLPSSPALHFPQ